MAGLVVEDGTGLSTADSLGSRSEANTYFAQRGAPTEWTALTDADDGGRDAALRYGTAWVCTRYGWPGIILQATQSLAWPRVTDSWPVRRLADPIPLVALYDSDGRLLDWPVLAVKHAVFEAALAHAKSAVNAVRRSGGAIEAATLGPLSVTYLGDGAMPEDDYAYIDSLVARIAAPLGGDGSIPILRG